MRKTLTRLFALGAITLMLVSCGEDSGTTASNGTGNGGSVSTDCTDSSTSSLPTCVRTDMSYE